MVVVNPRREPASVELDDMAPATPLLAAGVTLDGGGVRADGFGYGVFEVGR